MTGGGVVVREARASDAVALAALSRAVGREPGRPLLALADGRTAGDERRYIRAVRHGDRAAVFVAEEDGEIVGRLSVGRDAHPASAHVADLGLLVAASYRRRGIGRALLEAAVRWAQAGGVRKLELHVFPHNEPALALYRSFGFREEGYRRGHLRDTDGTFLDAVLMAYDVPAAVASPTVGR